MNERLSKILEYEKRLMQDRQQLQTLIEEQNRGTNANSKETDQLLVQTKLEHFSKELAYMNEQVRILKNAIPVDQAAEVQPAKQEMKPGTKSVTKQGDLEKTIGKSLMGIFASVLIFISLILFATLLLPYFNDTAKMITTYVVSFAFITVGLLKLRKNKANKFYLALTGCGVGALYISLLLSNMYFKVLGDIPLYILILIWGVGVCALSRLKTKLFQIIGHLGISISILFGCILCASTDDTAKFTVLAIFYFVTATIFFVAHYHREICKNLIFHIFNTINCVLLTLACCSACEKDAEFAFGVMIALLCVNFGLLIWSKTEAEGISFGLLAPFPLCELWLVLLDSLSTEGILFLDFKMPSPGSREEIIAIVLFTLAMAIVVAIDFKKIEDFRFGTYAVQFTALCLATAVANFSIFLCDYGYIVVFVWPLVCLGMFRCNHFIKYVNLFALFLAMIGISYEVGEVLHFIFLTATFVGMYAHLLRKKEEYHAVYKYFLHLLTLIFLSWNLAAMSNLILNALDITENRGDIVWNISYIAMVIFNLSMLQLSRKNKALKSSPAYYYLVNGIMMFAGIIAVGESDTGVLHLFLILAVIATFMVNAKNILDRRKNIFAGIYVGLKFTVLMVVILGSFDVVNYVISIACFLFAIAGIVIGFKFEYKALRIFGLVLSMISTFKLIMVDITYENTLGNAISFFVSGILCFVISLIYNLIDNKLNKQRELIG